LAFGTQGEKKCTSTVRKKKKNPPKKPPQNKKTRIEAEMYEASPEVVEYDLANDLQPNAHMFKTAAATEWYGRSNNNEATLFEETPLSDCIV
jgi:hypothetical protein